MILLFQARTFLLLLSIIIGLTVVYYSNNWKHPAFKFSILSILYLSYLSIPQTEIVRETEFELLTTKEQRDSIERLKSRLLAVKDKNNVLREKASRIP